MLLTAWEIVMPFQLIRWLRQCRVKTDRIVWVNVAKINASWRYERGFYIARGGRTRVAIGTRYAKVGDWVATGEKMWMPHIALDDTGGRLFPTDVTDSRGCEITAFERFP